MIDERKIKILQVIINDYITTGEPVGSRTIAKKYELGVSPATIRNEMADLEELGYLEQPHTSAGRIPSSKGYRLYVDKLMKQQQLSLEEQLAIKNEIIDMLDYLNIRYINQYTILKYKVDMYLIDYIGFYMNESIDPHFHLHLYKKKRWN